MIWVQCLLSRSHAWNGWVEDALPTYSQGSWCGSGLCFCSLSSQVLPPCRHKIACENLRMMPLPSLPVDCWVILAKWWFPKMVVHQPIIIINHPFWGIPIYGNHQMSWCISTWSSLCVPWVPRTMICRGDGWSSKGRRPGTARTWCVWKRVYIPTCFLIGVMIY
jgi:hypothetical protein